MIGFTFASKEMKLIFEVHQLIAWQLGLLQCYLFANLGYSQVTILQSSTNNLDIAELANFLQLCILL